MIRLRSSFKGRVAAMIPAGTISRSTMNDRTESKPLSGSNEQPPETSHLDQDSCATPEIRYGEAEPLRPPLWSPALWLPERGTILAKGLPVTSTSTSS